MHIVFIQLGAWIVAVIPGLGAIISFIRQLLGLGKDAVEMKKAIKELQDANTKKPDEDNAAHTERMKATAEVAKAYVQFGFLMYLYRTSMTVMALVVLRWAYEMLTRQEH